MTARVLARPQVPAPPKVCVAVPTYRRPEQLRHLLDRLARIAPPSGYRVDVLVMDNDPARSAAAIVSEGRPAFPFPLDYVPVPEPGLSSVRNFALCYALDGYDFLAMIDDDEVPQSQWLVELLRVQETTRADGVVGPVPQLVPDDAPRWIRAGRFYELPSYADQATIRDGYSGNCLLRVTSIERLAVAFDPNLNFAGGEDLMFFRAWNARGAHLAYAAKAIADEPLPADRLRTRYILKLNFRRGNTLALCDRSLDGRKRTLTWRALKACMRIARGCATLLPYSLLRGRAGATVAFCDVAHGAGTFAGLFGHTHHAYDRPDRARR